MVKWVAGISQSSVPNCSFRAFFLLVCQILIGELIKSAFDAIVLEIQISFHYSTIIFKYLAYLRQTSLSFEDEKKAKVATLVLGARATTQEKQRESERAHENLKVKTNVVAAVRQHLHCALAEVSASASTSASPSSAIRSRSRIIQSPAATTGAHSRCSTLLVNGSHT